MADESTNEVKEEIEYQTIAEFLESTPPNQLIHISDLSKWKVTQYCSYNAMRTPEIQLHCDDEESMGSDSIERNLIRLQIAALMDNGKHHDLCGLDLIYDAIGIERKFADRLFIQFWNLSSQVWHFI